ncbi:hypothetical protein PPERSA_08998 [Pseudocohnilembus persalinus]|uniref:Uncharacterized protein n=1 Tax=Pseudocohnilembus persalinus TaxID=266149 RepID=A0A0V0R315_PSEPJ|nr:hypothetical protein PPERSA_08998 [Pseudocohnilembus persalinus]|eukprot:KRX08894.1 hypothetical protein PPERSA_08998 [Pseudocohnilembus persalinus]
MAKYQQNLFNDKDMPIRNVDLWEQFKQYRIDLKGYVIECLKDQNDPVADILKNNLDLMIIEECLNQNYTVKIQQQPGEQGEDTIYKVIQVTNEGYIMKANSLYEITGKYIQQATTFIDQIMDELKNMEQETEEKDQIEQQDL